jgi:hypothetical protein
MSERPQSFENHAKMVPAFHYVALPILLVVLVSAVWRLVQDPSWNTTLGVLLAVALQIIALYARVFALGVQDRVIRLEERMRMDLLFPDDLKPRIGDFTTEQLIGLRFASDDEFVDLCRKVLDEGMADRKSVKAAVKSWRADHQRI